MARLQFYLIVILPLSVVATLLSWHATPAPPAVATYPNEQGKDGPTPQPLPKPSVDLFGDPLPPGALARMGTVRWRDGEVCCLAFSPDGKIIATGPINVGYLRLWDVASGREIRRMEGRALTVSFSADGQTLFSFGHNRLSGFVKSTGFEVRSWDVVSGKPLHAVEVPASWTGTFHPNLKAFILPENYSQALQKVSGVDAGTGKPVPLPAAWLESRNLAFSQDGSLVAMIDRNHRIRLLDRAGGKLRHDLGKLPEAFALVISPDGKRLAAGVGQSESAVIQVWDTQTGKSVSRCVGHQVGVQSLAFSADGNSLASDGRDMLVRLWDVGTGKERWRFNTPGGCIFMNFAFSPDGKTLAVVGRDGVLYLLDTITGKERQPVVEAVDPSVLAFTPDGKTLISGGCWSGALRLWEVATGKEIRRLRKPALSSYSKELKKVVHPNEYVWTVSCSPDGKRLAVGGLDGISLWDLTAPKEPRYLPSKDHACAYSPDGKHLATWYTSLTLWDAAATQKSWEIPGGWFISSVHFSPDGRLLASANSQGIRLWDVASGKELLKFTAQDNSDRNGDSSLVFAPDGKTLAAATSTEVSVWEVASGQKRCHFATAYAATKGMCFSPDGTLLVMAGGIDKEIRFRRVSTGEVVHRLRGHDNEVTSLAFTPDGSKLVSGGKDLTMLVWDVREPLQKLRPQEKSLTPQTLEALWQQLAESDTRKAHQALWSLRAAPRQAVPFLSKILRPQDSPNLSLIAKLVADLSSDKFPIRDKATRELEGLGRWVRPVLLEALAKSPPLETRLRIEGLLKHTDDKSPAPEVLRMLRAVEILEAVGTPEGRQVLEKLAQGKGESLLEKEARASLRRLAKR